MKNYEKTNSSGQLENELHLSAGREIVIGYFKKQDSAFSPSAGTFRRAFPIPCNGKK
jgi:hypothetical protein